MNLNRLSGLDPYVRAWAEWTIRVANYYGIYPTVTSGYRSIEEQRRLWDNRATNPYPVARPGSSSHNFGLAWDSSVKDDEWDAWNTIRRWAGWQLIEGDRVHAQVPDWRRYVDPSLLA